ncbi:hypothetical protein, partial [Enterocloster lavalensis]|uniref:hypothetical protein n=1 Tax=Enterocloster lavalensis TaxID=460384 RepID=UPI0034A2B6AE
KLRVLCFKPYRTFEKGRVAGISLWNITELTVSTGITTLHAIPGKGRCCRPENNAPQAKLLRALAQIHHARAI